MKVLFIASGNSSNFDIVPFIKSQGESLQKEGIDVEYFPVRGKGLSGYIRNAIELRKFIRKHQDIDIIHSHYSLCGLVSILAFNNKLKVHSFMGSDAYGVYIGEDKVKFKSRFLTLLTWAIQPFMDAIISKSANIDAYVYQKKKSYIVPNGVEVEKFQGVKSIDKQSLGLNPQKKYVLFLGSPTNKRKNYKLVEAAVEALNDSNVELIAPYPIPHDEVIQYLKVADVFAMSAFMEGSPNVVKEAMACNCPMVVTDVGDTELVVGTTNGCYVSTFEVDDYAEQLNKALNFSEKFGRTEGLDRIIELGLDSQTIARKIIKIYNKVLGN